MIILLKNFQNNYLVIPTGKTTEHIAFKFFPDTVGPRLSEHLCATSMLKVFR